MIPDEAVEAAAAAHYDSSPAHRATWVQLSAGHKRELMAPTRAALEAAAPYLLAAAWEEGYEGAVDAYDGRNVSNPYRKPADA